MISLIMLAGLIKALSNSENFQFTGGLSAVDRCPFGCFNEDCGGPAIPQHKREKEV